MQHRPQLQCLNVKKSSRKSSVFESSGKIPPSCFSVNWCAIHKSLGYVSLILWVLKAAMQVIQVRSLINKVLKVTQVKKEEWKDNLLFQALNLGPVTGSPLYQAIYKSLSPHSLIWRSLIIGQEYPILLMLSGVTPCDFTERRGKCYCYHHSCSWPWVNWWWALHCSHLNANELHTLTASTKGENAKKVRLKPWCQGEVLTRMRYWRE